MLALWFCPVSNLLSITHGNLRRVLTNMQVVQNTEGINAWKRIMLKLQSNPNRLESEPKPNTTMEWMQAWGKRKENQDCLRRVLSIQVLFESTVKCCEFNAVDATLICAYISTFWKKIVLLYSVLIKLCFFWNRFISGHNTLRGEILKLPGSQKGIARMVRSLETNGYSIC